MNQQIGFSYIWEYRVKPGSRKQFLRAYGPEGDWVRLFREADGYIRTELLCDADDPNRFVTIDRWVSSEARDKFRVSHSGEFESLDERFEALTDEERFIGDFESVSSV